MGKGHHLIGIGHQVEGKGHQLQKGEQVSTILCLFGQKLRITCGPSSGPRWVHDNSVILSHPVTLILCLTICKGRYIYGKNKII